MEVTQLPKNQKSKKTHKVKKHNLLTVFSVFIIVIFLFCSKYLFIAVSLYNDASTKINSISYSTFHGNQTTYLYDSKNTVLNKLYGSKNSIYLTSFYIPQAVKNAFISIEDKDYFNHGAFSIKANFRVLYSIIKSKGKITQGGSTITQQLARTVFLNFDKTYKRKLEEIIIAIKLDQKYTKQQILEFYINNINFANNAYGIEAASRRYFSKSCNELNLSEICFLAAIPNNPTYYNPIKNINNTLKRRDFILSSMKKNNYITDYEYTTAVNYKIVLNPEKYDGNVWIESYALNCAARVLMKLNGFQFKNTFDTQQDIDSYDKNYSNVYNECINDIRTNGYKIYTSIDMDKQKLLQDSLDNGLLDFTEQNKGIYSLQGSSVSIDNKTGYVIAIVGGRTSPEKDYLNRAFQCFRQPGSSLKPLAVYTPAFEKGYDDTSIINDHYIDGGPHNDGDVYMGDIPIRTAVQMSLNSVAYQIFNDITPTYGLSFVRDMDFNKIVKKDYTLSAALGGLTYGVTPIEMASAYSTLARGGEFIAPTCIRSIVNSQGQTIYENNLGKRRVYNYNASYLMSDILKGTLENVWGTAYNVRLNGITSAAKTGTTSNQKDGWLCGYSAYYTTVVWVGYDIPKYVDNLYGGTYPGQIWHNYMQQVHSGLQDKDFYTP